MPAIITHDFFAHDSFGAAQTATSLGTRSEREAFLLGNQGPDPLFYLELLSPLKEFAELGRKMHKQAPSECLLRLREAVDATSEEARGVARAYLAGFVCHYLLDRTVHPFVYFWERSLCAAGVEGLDERDRSVVHAEVERDLDEMVLFAKRNQTIEVWRPARETLQVSDATLEAVGRLYLESFVGPLVDFEPTCALIFPIAVRSYRVALRALDNGDNLKARALATIEHRLGNGRHSLARALAHRVRAEATSVFDNRDHEVWANPFTGVTYTASFWDLYNEALLQVAPAVSTVLADGFDEAAARELTGGLNFSGERVE